MHYLNGLAEVKKFLQGKSTLEGDGWESALVLPGSVLRIGHHPKQEQSKHLLWLPRLTTLQEINQRLKN